MTDKPKHPRKPKKIIGRVENLVFFDHGEVKIPSRIDTGAKSSSIWATSVRERKGRLEFCLFGPGYEHFTGYTHRTVHFWKTVVASSMGATQERYVVRLRIKLRGRKINARFTLADRSTQVYPVLVGRNILRGKFVVDVNLGVPDREREVARSEALQSILKGERRHHS